MAIQSEMQELVDEWVARFVSGDVDGATDMFTSDGAIYSPYDGAAIGIEAVREVHQRWMDSGETNKKLVVLEAQADGDLGYNVVRYSGGYPQDDGSIVTETGFSVNIVKRQPDGQWKFHISSLNSEVPPLAG